MDLSIEKLCVVVLFVISIYIFTIAMVHLASLYMFWKKRRKRQMIVTAEDLLKELDGHALLMDTLVLLAMAIAIIRLS